MVAQCNIICIQVCDKLLQSSLVSFGGQHLLACGKATILCQHNISVNVKLSIKQYQTCILAQKLVSINELMPIENDTDLMDLCIH